MQTNPTPAELRAMSEAAPCPFCGEHIERTESMAMSLRPPKLFHYYRHPRNECRMFQTMLWSGLAGSKDEETFLRKWNTRTGQLVHADEIAAAEARGRVAERADAVRWLRAQADDWGATAPFADAADAFERGEHLTPEPTQ